MARYKHHKTFARTSQKSDSCYSDVSVAYSYLHQPLIGPYGGQWIKCVLPTQMQPLLLSELPVGGAGAAVSETPEQH